MFSWMSGDFIKCDWYLTTGSMASYKGLFSKALNSTEMSFKFPSRTGLSVFLGRCLDLPTLLKIYSYQNNIDIVKYFALIPTFCILVKEHFRFIFFFCWVFCTFSIDFVNSFQESTNLWNHADHTGFC